MVEHAPDCGKDRESKMVRASWGSVYCDPCIRQFVRALNLGGIATKASCCGHGHRPANIILADDTFIFIVTREEAQRIDALFPRDINGDLIADRTPAMDEKQ